MTAWLLAVNLGVSGFLAGLIWVVQVVHYPLFGAVSGEREVKGLDERGAAYARAHAARITWIVAPAMLVEVLVVAALVMPGSVLGVSVGAESGGAERGGMLSESARAAVWVSAALVALVWVWTFAVEVPLHARLQRQGMERATVRWLVVSNWVRTAAWTVKLGLAGWLAAGGG